MTMTKEYWAARILAVIQEARQAGFTVGVTDTEDWGSGSDVVVGTGDVWVSRSDRAFVGVEEAS